MCNIFKIFLMFYLVSWGLATDCRVEASEARLNEYQVKTAYLYNFFKFVEWPRESLEGDGTLTICVLGDDPIVQVIETLQGKSVGSRTLRVRVVQDISEVSERCHLVYIPAVERLYFPSVLPLFHDRPVLLVSDMPGFAKQGGAIGFVWVGKNIRFEINLAAVECRGLKISSKLSGLATSIIRRRGECGGL